MRNGRELACLRGLVWPQRISPNKYGSRLWLVGWISAGYEGTEQGSERNASRTQTSPRTFDKEFQTIHRSLFWPCCGKSGLKNELDALKGFSAVYICSLQPKLSDDCWSAAFSWHQELRLKNLEASSKMAVRCAREALTMKALLEPTPFLLSQVWGIGPGNSLFAHRRLQQACLGA